MKEQPLFEVYLTDKYINILPQEFAFKHDTPTEYIVRYVAGQLGDALDRARKDK